MKRKRKRKKNKHEICMKKNKRYQKVINISSRDYKKTKKEKNNDRMEMRNKFEGKKDLNK